MKGNRSVVLLTALILAVVGMGVWFGLSRSLHVADGEEESDAVVQKPKELIEPDVVEPVAPVKETGTGKGRLVGRVLLFKTREPVPEVILHLTGGPEGFEERTELTDKDGRFEVRDLPAGEGFELNLKHGDFAPVRRLDIKVMNSEVTDLGSLFLETAIAFTVHVQDGKAAAVPKATVKLYSSAGRARDSQSLTWLERVVQATELPTPLFMAATDEKGEVSFKQLPAGYYSIAAEAAGFATAGVQKMISPDNAKEPVVIKLGKGYGIKGKVTDKEGKPVKGRVLITPQSMSFSWGMSFLRRASPIDEEGNYAFTSLPPGSAALAVEPEGKPYVPAGSVAIPDLEVYDIKLTEGASLEGTVTDPEGKPIPGVEIRAAVYSTRGGQTGVFAVTDLEGKYLIDNLPSGNLGAFEGLAEGFARYPPPGAQRAQLYLAPGSLVRSDVQMVKGIGLTGQVTEQQGGTPLGAAKVTAVPRGAWGGNSETVTADSEGKYKFESLAPGEYAMQVSAEGYFQDDFPSWWRASQPQYKLDDRWKMRVEEGATDLTKDFVLKEGGVVSGRLEDTYGKPVPGVNIWVSRQSDSTSAISDQEGNWTAKGIKEGQRIYASAWMPGRWARSEYFSMSPGGRVEGFFLTLKATARIEGTVELEDGSPPEGGYAWWVYGDPKTNPWVLYRSPGSRVPVGDDGSYKLEGVNPGRVSVVAMIPGHPPAFSEPLTIDAGNEAFGIRVLVKEGHSITGLVKLKTGEPVVGAEIGISAENSSGYVPGMTSSSIVRAQTDKEGKFHVDGLPKSKYRVTARKDRLTPASQRGVDPTEGRELELEMEEGGEVTGVVLDNKNAPVSGLRVWMTPEQGTKKRGALPQSSTSTDGTFRLTGVPEGTYKLSSGPSWGSKLNYTTGEKTGVRPGDSDIELRVEPGFKIAGKALDPDGRPAGGYSVSVRGAKTLSMQTQHDGKFEFAGLPAGKYTVSLQVWGGGMASVSQKGVSAGTENLVIQLTLSLTITGFAIDELGNAVSSVRVRANPMPGSPGGSGYSRTNSYGMYTIKNLPAGSYLVTFSSPGRYAPQEVGDVLAGSEGISVVMYKGREIHGIVYGLDSKPVSGVYVSATQLGGGVASSGRSNREGKFIIKGLNDGYHTLTVSVRNGGWMHVEPVTVETGAKDAAIYVERGLGISGMVVDETGMGVANCWISVTGGGRWSRTQSDGSFKIDGVEPGTVKLQVYGNSKNIRVEVRAGDTGVLIRLE